MEWSYEVINILRPGLAVESAYTMRMLMHHASLVALGEYPELSKKPGIAFFFAPAISELVQMMLGLSNRLFWTQEELIRVTDNVRPSMNQYATLENVLNYIEARRDPTQDPVAIFFCPPQLGTSDLNEIAKRVDTSVIYSYNY